MCYVSYFSKSVFIVITWSSSHENDSKLTNDDIKLENYEKLKMLTNVISVFHQNFPPVTFAPCEKLKVNLVTSVYY